MPLHLHCVIEGLLEILLLLSQVIPPHMANKLLSKCHKETRPYLAFYIHIQSLHVLALTIAFHYKHEAFGHTILLY